MEHIYLAEKLRQFDEAELALRSRRGQIIERRGPGVVRALAYRAGLSLVLWGSRLQEWARTRQPDAPGSQAMKTSDA